MPADRPNLTGTALVAVFAHPDDESLACGGLLALCAEAGSKVTLVCVTQGEDAPTADGDRDALRSRRAGELLAATRLLGISDVRLLDYPDGELPWLDDERAARLRRDISSVIAETAAAAVVTFAEDGLYWHPDHIALHEQTTAAVEALGDRGPALYYVTMPPGAVRALAEAAGASTVLGIDDPDAFGACAEPPTLVVDVRRFARRKLAALKAHASQADGAIARLDENEAPRLLGEEHFRRAQVGAQGSTFLDGLAN